MKLEKETTSHTTADETSAPLICCWGTRGSVPSPGPATVRFGGNTPCVELRLSDERSYIFDAGTGIIALGNQLMTTRTRHVDVFLTHFHWDHIQGLPFFAPLHDHAWNVRIHALPTPGTSTEELLAVQMREPYFPVELQDFSTGVEFAHMGRSGWGDDAVEIVPFRVRHPGHTYAFRVRCDGASVVYIPDNEISGSSYDVPASWERDLIDFVAGADILIHDAMFTTAEYRDRQGWGHGTFEQAVQLAESAGVPHLLLFHHAPERSDAELEAKVKSLQSAASVRGVTLAIEAAAEGKEIILARLGAP